METKLCCDRVSFFFYYWQLDNKKSKNGLPEGDSARSCVRVRLPVAGLPTCGESQVSGRRWAGQACSGSRLLHTVPPLTTYDRIQTDAPSERPLHHLLHQGLNCTSLLCSLWCNWWGASCVYFYFFTGFWPVLLKESFYYLFICWLFWNMSISFMCGGNAVVAQQRPGWSRPACKCRLPRMQMLYWEDEFLSTQMKTTKVCHYLWAETDSKDAQGSRIRNFMWFPWL